MPHRRFHRMTIAKSPRLATLEISALTIKALRILNFDRYTLKSQMPTKLNTCAMTEVYTVKNR